MFLVLTGKIEFKVIHVKIKMEAFYFKAESQKDPLNQKGGPYW